ncbi:ParA family protein [Lacticaseibacillus suibinensis]|jgi:cellulose biosynthesis protein BcsQ|uniref:ParA family protein n=1 Tax=Lacticaseibacillus suibinensis TaxID=2486011 RepID=UPI0019452CF3|nr:ParA family protein [Lacticaseibacillus suibinensis]
MATTYVVGNFKGGVGKTKLVTMLAYENAAVKGKRTLVVDLDPQGNATSILAKTGDIPVIERNITNGFIDGDLTKQITNILPNLDIIGSNTAFRSLPKILMKKFPDDDLSAMTYLRKLLEPLQASYDSIYLDVPPTISDYSDNAMMAADYCIIVLQTQSLSLDGAKTYIAYMQYLADTFDSKLDILGIVACMLRPGGRVDESIIEEARQTYGNNVLSTVIRYQERLKAYDVEGIHVGETKSGLKDSWDIKAHGVFVDVLDELNAHEDVFRKMKEAQQ